MAKLTNQDIYEDVTARILAALEAGVAPWRKPWIAGHPSSLATKRPYRGVNALLLSIQSMAKGYSSRWWLTFKQAKRLGGNVRRGEKGTRVVLWKFIDRTVRDEQGEEKESKIPILRTFTVFNADQCELPEGTVPSEAASTPDADIDAIGQSVLDDWEDKPDVQYGGDRASYVPKLDRVFLPVPESFISSGHRWGTCFHELTHSTGHKDRLNRDGVSGNINFGSEEYSKEELIAELGACFVAASVGIPLDVESSAAYLKGWTRALNDDPKMIISASGKAQRAADMILGTDPQN